jgi:signal transduction histidine kinase
VNLKKTAMNTLQFSSEWFPKTSKGADHRLPALLTACMVFLYVAMNYAEVEATVLFTLWISFGACLGLVVTFLKEQQNQRLRELRTKISADLHDEVGGILTGLSMQTELLEHKTGEVKACQLRRLRELSRKALAGMRDLVWAMDAEKDSWGSLIDRLNDHAQETLHPLRIQLEICEEGICREEILSDQMREHVYRIAKEALTNVAKHATADRVRLSFQKTAGAFTMTIHDNGETPGKVTHCAGCGLQNMKRRAAKMGGELQVAAKEGFLVRLTV